jgi:TolA-binding protein
MPAKKWTEEEEGFLRENYMTMSNAELAEKFGITKNAVQKKLARMELKRSEAAKKQPPDEKSEAEVEEEKKGELVTTESHFSSGNRFFYEDRDYKQALEEYKQAAEEESDELLGLKERYWMAECYVKMQKIEEAMDIFRTLAEEHGDHYLGDSAGRRFNALTEHVVPIA